MTPNGLHDATNEKTQIESWWTQWPSANIGLRTGAMSGIVVLDIDPRNGGSDSLQALETLHGPLPDTVESLTGGGGRHLIFQHPGGHIKSRSNVFGADFPGIDVKADDGYIVAPPSTHISGQNYEWEVSSPRRPATLPDWLKEKLVAQATISAPNSSGTIPEGARNSRLTSFAGTMRRCGMGEAALLAALSVENQAKCLPPLDELEVRQIVQSVARYQPTAPRPETTPAIALRLTTLGELLAEPEEVSDFIVEGLLPSAGLSLLVAKPKTGKSTLARQLALAIVQGAPFLGRTVKKGIAFYLALEERRADVRSHFKVMGAIETDAVRLFVGRAPEDAIAQLRAAAEGEKPSLIIVDTMARLVRFKDINDYAQTTTAIEPLLALAREVGAHVMLLHHARKGDGKGIDSTLGSTGLSGSVDTILYLNRTEEYRTMATIQRVGTDMPETVLLFDEDTRMTTLGGSRGQVDHEKIQAEIIKLLEASSTAMEREAIFEAVEGNQARKHRALKALATEGVIIRTGSGRRGDPYHYAAVSCTAVPSISPVQEYKQPNDEITDRKHGGLSCTGNLADFVQSPTAPVQDIVAPVLEIFPGTTVVKAGAPE